MKNSARNTGFTLIETIIYSGIVTAVLTFFLTTFYYIIDSSDRSLSLIELAENQKFLVQKIGWVLSNNAAINSPPLGSSGTTLSVNKIGAAANPFIITSSGTFVTMASGTTPAVPLTNSWVSVANLQFHHLDFSGRSAIRITADLQNIVSSTTIDTTIFMP